MRWSEQRVHARLLKLRAIPYPRVQGAGKDHRLADPVRPLHQPEAVGVAIRHEDPKGKRSGVAHGETGLQHPAESLVQQGFLQLLQRGELPFVEAGEALGCSQEGV